MPPARSTADERLLPAPIRRPAALLAGVCVAVFLVLAVMYHGGRAPGHLDARLFLALSPTGTVKHVLDHVATAAPLVAVGVVVVVTTALLLARQWRDAAFAAAAPALALVVAELGKLVVDRTLDGFLALPSGHTAGITSVALTVAVLRLHRSGHVVRTAVLGLLGATLFGAAIALIMVSLRDHYPTDTLAGYCAAVATTLGVAFAADLLSGYLCRRAAGRHHHTEASTSNAASASPSSSTNVETVSSTMPLLPCRVAISPVTASSPIAAKA